MDGDRWRWSAPRAAAGRAQVRLGEADPPDVDRRDARGRRSPTMNSVEPPPMSTTSDGPAGGISRRWHRGRRGGPPPRRRAARVGRRATASARSKKSSRFSASGPRWRLRPHAALDAVAVHQPGGNSSSRRQACGRWRRRERRAVDAGAQPRDAHAADVRGRRRRRRTGGAWSWCRCRWRRASVARLGASAEPVGYPAADRVVAARQEPGVVRVEALHAPAGAAHATGGRGPGCPAGGRRRARRRSARARSPAARVDRGLGGGHPPAASSRLTARAAVLPTSQ